MDQNKTNIPHYKRHMKVRYLFPNNNEQKNSTVHSAGVYSTLWNICLDCFLMQVLASFFLNCEELILQSNFNILGCLWIFSVI